MNKKEKVVIREVTDFLDVYMGDTDPEIPLGYTEEEIQTAFPILWVMQQLSRLKTD